MNVGNRGPRVVKAPQSLRRALVAYATEASAARRLHTTVMAKKRKQAAAPATPQKPLIDISEDEQWRIIRDSGVLKTISSKEERSAQPQAPEELLSPFTLEVFAALALIIPFSCLLLMMEMYALFLSLDILLSTPRSLVHYQYGRKPTFEELADRMIPGVPSEF